MRNSALARDTGLWRDMAALRRYFWLPLAAVAVAVVAVLGLGAVLGDSGEARFRVNVVVDALPPLFGPAVLPGPFDYAAVATSDAVVADVATRTGTTAEAVRQHHERTGIAGELVVQTNALEARVHASVVA